MPKFRLKRVVTVQSVWEVSADSPAEGMASIAAGQGHQIGWDNIVTSYCVLSANDEESAIERPLKENLENKNELHDQ